MRVGILTHPQGINYGGILQCYALCEYFRLLGHEVVVIQRGLDIPLWKQVIIGLISGFKRLLHTKKYDRAAKIRLFSQKQLPRTKQIHSQSVMKRLCKQYKLNAVVVGSDQVWRSDYALNFGYNYFLDFVPDGIHKLSYAASFGLSTWDYSLEQSKRIKELLAGYKGVSVREDEAVVLCKTHLGIDVKQMPDPSMLLTALDYDQIASPRLLKENYIFVYWLGDKRNIDEMIAFYESKGYNVIYVGLREQRILPAVEEWLSYIKYAKLVITDSFHGCVFSTLYHRPLKVCENKSGGYGRIQSLFQSLGVNIENLETLTRDEYCMIDNRLKALRETAKLFIEKSLS